MTVAVLDASAVIALLKGERGGGKVANVVADAAIGVFNHAEVISHYVHLGAPLDDVRAMLGALLFKIVAANEGHAWDAGLLRSMTANVGLSLGDRFCLALARELGVPAYTADRAWKEISADAGVTVVLIR